MCKTDRQRPEYSLIVCLLRHMSVPGIRQTGGGKLSSSLCKSCIMDIFQTCMILLQVCGQIFYDCVLQNTVRSERVPLDEATK